MKDTLTKYIISLLCMVTLAACQDDFFRNDGYFVVGDGEAVVSLESMFYPNGEARLDTRTDGDVIDEITDLYVAFYDVTTEKLKFSRYFAGSELSITPMAQREEGGADHDPICKATVSDVRIPYGRYYVMAVANMGDLGNGEDVATLDSIRKYRFDWRKNIASNNQMSGVFALDRLADPMHSLLPDSKPSSIIIKGDTKTLHAWLMRAASKVTVDFDGSELNQNVYVHIQSIAIKDAPGSCLLFNRNKPTEKSQLIPTSDSILLSTSSSYKDWPAITRGGNEYRTQYMANKPVHARDSKVSLFFYENRQGKGEKSKHQVDPDVPGASQSAPTWPDGVNPENDKWKDCMPYGTYVEVKGYYESFTAGNHTQGHITYRFMLGKDVDYDYDAERNYHYKLTLKFKGNANDIDWHIDYREESQFWCPSPYYISYLYNKSMFMPVQTQGRVARIEAKIVRNDWYPSGETPEEQAALDNFNKRSGGIYPVYWADPSYNYTCSAGVTADPEVWDDDVCMGFLSLRSDSHRTIEMNYNEFNQNGGSCQQGAPYIDKYWHTNNLGYRTFHNPHLGDDNLRNNFLQESSDEEYKGLYMVEDESYNGNIRYVFKIPLYTRGINLVTNTSHTGNNPFYGYVRKAMVRMRAFDEDGGRVQAYDPETGEHRDYLDVEIIQVRRIVNPKGIFRHAQNAEQFHVILMEHDGDYLSSGDTGYRAFNSHGSWTATVKAGADWVCIGHNPNPTSSVTIYGDTETPIEFYFKPSGIIPVDQQRGGLIEITYHNNTCVHQIVVKQGYAPVQMIDGRDGNAPHAKWSNFNMRAAKEMCTSPLEEGSYFRAGRQTHPIDPSTTWDQPVKTTISTVVKYPTSEGTEPWTTVGITVPNVSNENHFGAWNFTKTGDYAGTYHVAELQDFFYLRNNKGDYQITSDIDVAYGIVYGDGATEPQTDAQYAHGYKYSEGVDDSGAYPRSIRGMRGCVVYNNGSVGNLAGNSIFFPAGVNGYGRLVSNNVNASGGTDAKGTAGIIRYGRGRGVSGNSAITTDMDYRPLLHRLDINFGMIYWHRRYHKSGFGNSSAWDFNMSTFDFNTFSGNGNYDACLVRMVLNTEDSKYKAQDEPVFPTYPHNTQ